MIGLGIDMCRISRMQRMLENDRFLSRYFSGEEQDYVKARGRMGPDSAAAIFAAKEAALKALGTGFAGISPQDVVILHGPSGQPYYELRGTALERMRALNGRQMHLSMTHEEDLAAAVAVLE